jgi:hypothetical protein
MTATIINSNPLNDSHALTASPEGGCKHHTRNGRCRLPVADPLTSLCAEHARHQQKRDHAAKLSAELIAGLTEFKSAVPINDFLSRLLLFQAQDRIPPRRAAVMAYTCNLLLRTLPAIHLEQKDKAEKDRDPLDDFPPHLREMILYKRRIAAEHHAKLRGAQATSPEDASRAYYQRLGSQRTSNNGETSNTTNTKESS